MSIHWRDRARRLLAAAVAIGAVGTAVVTLAALIPVWPLMLFEHFRLQVAIGGAIVTAAAFALRMKHADVAALATLLTLVAIVPDLSSQQRPVPAGVAVRVLSLNVLTSNMRYADVARLIEQERPDVVALVEVSQEWLDALAPALAEYGGRIEKPRDDNFGIAVYAHGELRGDIRTTFAPTPVGRAEAVVNGATFRIVVAHPVPPITPDYQRVLERYFADLGTSVHGDPRVVVAGDFNATPWSRPFATMMRASGLCDSRAGFGVQASFPAGVAILRIPIDHVLVACEIGVRDRRIGPDVGSDHLPVIVDLVVPP